MPQSETITRRRVRRAGRGNSSSKPGNKHESRYSVALSLVVAKGVEEYAEAADASMSKAIATLVRLGLESQESRKRDFFKKLKENLANDDQKQQDRLVEEFRAFILGH